MKNEIGWLNTLAKVSDWNLFIPSQSELFWFIPITVSEPMRIIPNQSEKCFVSRLMKNGQKSIRLDAINSETSIRMNPNQSETKFSIQIDNSWWNYLIGLKFGTFFESPKSKDEFLNQTFATNGSGLIHKIRFCRNQTFHFRVKIYEILQ